MIDKENHLSTLVRKPPPLSSASPQALPGTRTSKLANQFASFNAAQTRQQYEELAAAIQEKSERLDSALTAAENVWDELLPHLRQMQALLSQRGKDRQKVLSKAKLPTWSDWFAAFRKQRRWPTTLRAVQKHLAALRGPTERKKSQPTPKLSPRNQERLLEAQQCGNELVAALENGADYSGPLKEFKRVALDPEKLSSILEAREGTGDSFDVELIGLAREGFAIIRRKFGDCLMADAEGRRALAIAARVLDGKRPPVGPVNSGATRS